jgi:hypothetical protein
MGRGTFRTARLAGWRAWMARLLSTAVLLASLLVPPPAESAAATPSPTVAAAAASDRDGGAGRPSCPDGIVHAGSHCTCHVADRLNPPQPAAPASFSALAHPVRRARALASFEAEPPARPPRA